MSTLCQAGAAAPAGRPDQSDRVDRVDRSWQAAAPWVTAGIAGLGETLVRSGLCAANPASNADTGWAGEAFVLEPGRFATAELEVRWNRHIGHAGLQDRPCSAAAWKALAAACRRSLPAPPA